MSFNRLLAQARELQSQGKLEAAFDAYSRLIAENPNLSEAYFQMARIESKKAHYAASESLYKQALTVNGPHILIFSGLGVSVAKQGRYEDALYWLNKATDIDPDSAQAWVDKSMIQLLLGRYQDGWLNYQWRFHPTYSKFKSELAAPLYPFTPWRGESLVGKRVLVMPEQGIGDAIQFSRYGTYLQEQGAEVTFLVEPHLEAIFNSLKFNISTIKVGEVVLQNSFDFAIYPMELPFYLKLYDPSEFQDFPYLDLNQSLVDWAERWYKKNIKKQGLRVGLVWAGNPNHGNDQHRSMSIDDFDQILQNFPEINWVSLQLGSKGYQGAVPVDRDCFMVDPTPLIQDVSQLGAFVKGLDLLVSIDSAPVHLAGALNVPCWCLLPFVPDWRWGVVDQNTPWYSSVRLLRQSAAGDWSGVLTNLQNALQNLIVKYNK